MKIISFDTDINNRIKRDPKQENLFDLFQKNTMNAQNLDLSVFIVPREFEMRLDRISNFIYGSPNYVEELMALNDIINPYSVKEGQYIYFCEEGNLQYLYTKDDLSTESEKKRQQLIKSSQPNRSNQSIPSNQNLPLTIKPSNLNQITVGADNNVKIINSFE